jgi:hypothetical protein
MAKKRSAKRRPTAKEVRQRLEADMRTLERAHAFLQDAHTAVIRERDEARGLHKAAHRQSVENATLLEEARTKLDVARADSLRAEIETWGLTFSRLGVGMRTGEWPFIEFVVGVVRDIRLRLHAREALTRGMDRILKAMLFWEPTGEGAVDFDRRRQAAQDI